MDGGTTVEMGGYPYKYGYFTVDFAACNVGTVSLHGLFLQTRHVQESPFLARRAVLEALAQPKRSVLSSVAEFVTQIPLRIPYTKVLLLVWTKPIKIDAVRGLGHGFPWIECLLFRAPDSLSANWTTSEKFTKIIFNFRRTGLIVKRLVKLYSILLIGNYYPNREKFCDTCRTAAGGTPPPLARGSAPRPTSTESTRRVEVAPNLNIPRTVLPLHHIRSPSQTDTETLLRSDAASLFPCSRRTLVSKRFRPRRRSRPRSA